MRQRKYAPLAVPAYGNFAVARLAQPVFRIQTVLQQIIKGKAGIVPV